MVRSAADGVLHLVPLPSISETCELVAISEFGDLFCYAALAGFLVLGTGNSLWRSSAFVSGCILAVILLMFVKTVKTMGCGAALRPHASCASASLARTALSQRLSLSSGQRCGSA